MKGTIKAVVLLIYQTFFLDEELPSAALWLTGNPDLQPNPILGHH